MALETLRPRVSHAVHKFLLRILVKGAKRSVCVTNSALQGVVRQTRKDKGFRLDAQALCHATSHPELLAAYMKLVNSIEASLEPSAISPSRTKVA